ncbi:MAG: hypothetical protein CSA58_09245 [Micrococcales bacterium]|nr:MAG: hypothetical protein CSA58_09245 [Micrococcales bacterium]
MTQYRNLLPPEEIRLPDEPDATVAAALADRHPQEVAAAHPASPRAWAALAAGTWADGQIIPTYAYARVGYHRGLDALRKSGWKGTNPVPWEHEPNQGFLRCVYLLGQAAAVIGETDEQQRCAEFLTTLDPHAVDRIEGR